MIIRHSSLGARRPAVLALADRGIRKALRPARLPRRAEVNVIWTDRRRLRAMNRRFRRMGYFTDVIAFRYWPEKKSPSVFKPDPGAGLPFGDLYIAVDQARIFAKKFGVAHKEELVRLAVHGALHLLGHTDYTPRTKRRMWAVQEPIVRRVMRRKR